MKRKKRVEMKRKVMTLIVRPSTYLRTTICPRSSPEAQSLEDAVRSLGLYQYADRLLPRMAASMSSLRSILVEKLMCTVVQARSGHGTKFRISWKAVATTTQCHCPDQPIPACKNPLKVQPNRQYLDIFLDRIIYHLAIHRFLSGDLYKVLGLGNEGDQNTLTPRTHPKASVRGPPECLEIAAITRP